MIVTSIVEGMPLAIERSLPSNIPEVIEDLGCDEEVIHVDDEIDNMEDKLSAIAIAASLATATIEKEAIEREAELEAEHGASLAVFRQALEVKRQQKREAELVHDQKIIDAVCAASLLEYTERQRIEKELEDEESALHELAESKRSEWEASKAAARRSKTSAVQSVIDLKSKAHEAKVHARKAIEEYELKEKERQERLVKLAEVDSQRSMEFELAELKHRQVEATLRREKSERRALEASQRAEALKQGAVDAAKQMRIATKQGIDAVLEKEDMMREHVFTSQLHAVQAKKDEATRRRKETEEKAAEAARRAEALRLQAMEAAKQMRIVSKQNMVATLEKEETLRQHQFKSEMSAVQVEREEATRLRMEKEAQAKAALERAESLRAQLQAHGSQRDISTNDTVAPQRTIESMSTCGNSIDDGPKSANTSEMQCRNLSDDVADRLRVEEDACMKSEQDDAMGKPTTKIVGVRVPDKKSMKKGKCVIM